MQSFSVAFREHAIGTIYPRTNMEFHPVADLFPLMSAEEFDGLCTDIAGNGLNEAIWTYDGQIVDGRNRFNACRAVGVEPRFRDWTGEAVGLVAFVTSLNLRRRHLSESQRAMVAAKLANLSHSGRPSQSTQICGIMSQSIAAEMLNVSPRAVSSARTVTRDGVPELARLVESDEISVSEAVKIAKLPPRRQKAIIQRGRKARKTMLNRLQTRSLKTAFRVGCLSCDPAATANKAAVSAHMQRLAFRFPHFKPYFDDIIEEIESEELSDETRSNYERIYAAIDAGRGEKVDCRRATGLGQESFDLTIAAMLDYDLIEVIKQGGKTEAARGAAKVLYQRKAAAETDWTDLHDNDDDEFLDL